jgi:hypothetical protein
MPRFRNVVIFGDSLSDIGTKVQTKAGKVGKLAGEVTTNPTGRFSDCRNWTDHMYEECSGETLLHGDVKTSIADSRKHQKLGAESKWNGPAGKWFRYANYAMGGACGGIPNSKGPFLSTMKDQVDQFRKDYAGNAAAHGENFLFIVWFGANDLYTAGLAANKMASVANKIAEKRREEVAAIVGPNNAKFVYINLGLPLSATRYQRLFDESEAANKQAMSRVLSAQRSKKDLKVMQKHYDTRKMINNFESGVMLFNHTLRECNGRKGDTFVDMSSVLSREAVSALLDGMDLLPGSQEKGSSKRHYASDEYDKRVKHVHVTTSDDAHPTDRVYRLMWTHIKGELLQQGYSFGQLG